MRGDGRCGEKLSRQKSLTESHFEKVVSYTNVNVVGLRVMFFITAQCADVMSVYSRLRSEHFILFKPFKGSEIKFRLLIKVIIRMN